MSRPKSKQTDLQRFSGPELGELLDQVVSELGSTAAISAVNRIRSGGVAGFFCREEFEVIVDAGSVEDQRPRSDIDSSATAAGSATGIAPDHGALNGGAPDHGALNGGAPDHGALNGGAPDHGALNGGAQDHSVATGIFGQAGQAQPGTPQPVFAQQPFPAQPVSPGTATAQPAAADSTATHPGSAAHPGDPGTVTEGGPGPPLPLAPDFPVHTPTPLVGQPVASRDAPVHGPDGATEVFGGPRPRAMNGTDDGFMALLERRLDEASAAESPLVGRRSPPNSIEGSPGPSLALPDREPVIPAPGIAAFADQPIGGVGVPAPGLGPSAQFWLRLQRAEQELASFMPVASSFVATIGPLSLTTPIVGRLRSRPGLSSADVVVLTNRTEIVSEPHWKLLRSGNQLVEEAQHRGDRPTLLLIDVPLELPNWVAPLLNRLRMAGVGQFRYAVPGNPSAETLDGYRFASDVPYVIDLISRVQPDRLVEFVTQRHPIASVSGADLTAELLVAMREQVGLGH